MRDLKEFLGTVFKVNVEQDTQTVILSTLGNGHKNMNKNVT
jgi:hypothetical protein